MKPIEKVAGKAQKSTLLSKWPPKVSTTVNGNKRHGVPDFNSFLKWQWNPCDFCSWMK